MNYIDEHAEAVREAIPDDAMPQGDTTELMRLYALLALSKGATATAEDVHNAWAVWMSSKEADHPSLKPFEELPA